MDGVEDGLVLEADFAVRCFQGEHLYYAIGGFICMGVYVMGIPSVMAFLLWKNRAHLHDKTSEKNKEVEAFLGGLYQQCKSEHDVLYLNITFQKHRHTTHIQYIYCPFCPFEDEPKYYYFECVILFG